MLNERSRMQTFVCNYVKMYVKKDWKEYTQLIILQG